MQSFLTIIAPYATPLNVQFYMLLAATILGAVLCYLLMTKRLAPNFKLSGLIGMLLGFIGLISAGTSVLSYVHATNIKPLTFKSSELHYGNKIIPYNKVDRHFIKALPQQSRYSAQINTDTALLFVIEMRNKQSYLFSNEYYNVLDLKKAMNEYAPK